MCAQRYGATLGRETGGADDSREYWARAKPKKLIPTLRRKRQEFLQFFDDSGFFRRIERSWEYYHGLAYGPPGSSTDIRIAGDEGELRLTDINEFRANIGLLKTYITEGLIEWDALATADTGRALSATKKANSILEGLQQSRTHHFEAALDQAVEDALILTAGYVWNRWDETIGSEVMADPEGDRIVRGGDLRPENPDIFSVVYDHTRRNFWDSTWVDARRQENRWELAAQYPKHEARILALGFDTSREFLKFDFDLGRLGTRASDHRWVHYFYHEATPALPRGRFVKYVGDVELESVDYLPDGHIPLHRIIPAQFLLTAFGYTPAFSAQGPQELLNGVSSCLATNFDVLGSAKIWKKPGEPLNRVQLENGITVLECDTEPKVLNFYNPPDSMLKSLDLYTQQVGRMIGTNETARGAPEHNIKAAAAMAFTEQRVHQAASDLVGNFDQLLSDVGSSIIQIYARRMRSGEKRSINIRSSATARSVLTFTAEELEGVADVTVVRGNPALRTLGGRIRVAETLLEKGAAGPDEFLTVIRTGNLNKLTEGEDNQLDVIHNENDRLLSGDPDHAPLPTDNHLLHIRRHIAALDTPEARRDPEIARWVYEAALQHVQMLTDPTTMQLQLVLGYLTPEQAQLYSGMPPVPGAGMPGGAAGGGAALPQGGMPPGAPAPGPQRPQLMAPAGGPRMTGGVPEAALARIEQGAA